MAYESEATREPAAKALAEKRRNHGEAVSRFDPKMWARYLEFQRIVGEGVDPVVVAVEWRASKQGTPAGIGMPVKEAYAKDFALREEEKSWGDAAASHATTRLDRFTGKLGAKHLNEVSTEDVREWLRTVNGHWHPR